MPRAYIDGEPITGGGSSVEFGETLKKANGVVDVAIPVNGVISQEDFDALPDGKRNHGLYVIHDNGGPSGDAGVDLRGPAGPDGNPIGTVISFMGLKAPKDYLICDGSAYKIADYPNLVSFFKDQFGSETYFGSNGEGTFKVPDMRNLFLRGYHGGANETLSGNVGKRQEGTIHPNISSGTAYGLVFPNVIVSIENRDTIIDSNNNKRYILNESVGHENSPMSDKYTSRPVNMAVLYCIKAVDSQTVYETFEEYDTTVDGCDWHVRKWSNGYCEFSGQKSYTVNIDKSFGSIYQVESWIGGENFPFILIEKYEDIASLVPKDFTVWLAYYPESNGLIRSSRIIIYRPTAQNDVSLGIRFHVTGRWK